MRKLVLKMFRLYFRYFPIRKGKIPVLNLIDKTGLTRNFIITSSFDKNILINLNMEDWIQKQIFYFGRYEIEKKETLFWQNLIKESENIFDIGANIGYYSLMASIRIGNQGKIFAFEPVTVTYNKLIQNIELNKFINIIPERIAMSDMNGEIELFVADEKSTGSSSISNHVNFSGIKEKVKTISVDDYVYNNNIDKLNIVKIDVEGCEPMVIKGMTKTMNNFKPLILIEVLDERLNTVGSSKEKLFDLFIQNNYSGYQIIEENIVENIKKPMEGGLIIFKHNDTPFPSFIKIS